MILSRFIFLLAVPAISFAEPKAVVDVSLNPAGSFKAETAKVTGFAYKTADGVAAENVEVDLRSLQTGISLRDKHTKKRLMTEKYPTAKLIKATGKNGKGTAKVEIKGITREVSGTYEIKNGNLVAHFPIQLTDLKIDDINYMGVGVEDEVKLTVVLPIKEAGRNVSSVTKPKKK